MSTLTQESTQSYTSTANYTQFGPKLKTTLPGPLAQKIVAAGLAIYLAALQAFHVASLRTLVTAIGQRF